MMHQSEDIKSCLPGKLFCPLLKNNMNIYIYVYICVYLYIYLYIIQINMYYIYTYNSQGLVFFKWYRMLALQSIAKNQKFTIGLEIVI